MGTGKNIKLRPESISQRSGPSQRENTGEDDSEVPYPVGEHGLYVLQEPVTKEPRPNLPRANSNVQYGVSKPVAVEDDRFLQPGEPISMQQMLEEGPPEEIKPPSKAKRNFFRALKFLVDPKADPEFWYLPKGANNKIEDKECLKDKLRRLGKQKNIRKKPKGGFAAATNIVYVQNEEYAMKLPRSEPAPTRYVPPIEPTVAFERGPTADEFGNPFGGENSAFYETPEQRQKRIDARTIEICRRELSDKILAERNTPQLRNSVIGWAPPLTDRKLKQYLNNRRFDARRQGSISRRNSIVHTSHQDDYLPEEEARTHYWDRKWLEKKVQPQLSLNLDTLSQQAFGSPTFGEGCHEKSPLEPEVENPHTRKSNEEDVEVATGGNESVKFPVMTSPKAGNSPRPSIFEEPNEERKEAWDEAATYLFGGKVVTSPSVDNICNRQAAEVLAKKIAQDSNQLGQRQVDTILSPQESEEGTGRTVLSKQKMQDSLKEKDRAVWFKKGSQDAIKDQDQADLSKQRTQDFVKNQALLLEQKAQNFRQQPLPRAGHGQVDIGAPRPLYSSSQPADHPSSNVRTVTAPVLGRARPLPQVPKLYGVPSTSRPRGLSVKDYLTEDSENHRYPRTNDSRRQEVGLGIEISQPPPIPLRAPPRPPVHVQVHVQVHQIPRRYQPPLPQPQRAPPPVPRPVQPCQRDLSRPHPHVHFETLSYQSPSTRPEPFASTPALVPASTSTTPVVPAAHFPYRSRSGYNIGNRIYSEDSQGPGAHQAEMDKLQVRPTEFSSVRAKAVEDARQMQATVIELASKTGKDPPKYALLELIGKGSFGRVYKGKDMTSAAIVAVKIIDIDESDTINPRNADSYSEFLKEVNALKILSENHARNINHVIEALPVGQSMWMITEHCGGGSVATLMKPTAPGGLQEKWIIPILREVAEAIKWVHQAGIIHRDIKCANVLITEQGGVQLCDFGVAGIVEHKLDKRSTVIGTPHWMAPELFSSTPSYGKEVDIWAFGSMVFEIATGLPPNVANGIPYERLGSHLKTHVPRLEGGNYSNDLRNLVAYCLEELPSARPSIEQVQKHPYIYNTSSRYPTSSLSYLVRAFKMWEDHGGSRKSLFMLGGAQRPSLDGQSASIPDDEWNFSTTASFDQEAFREYTPQDVYEAYGTSVELGGIFTEDTSRPTKQQTQKSSRRRPPPEALARLPAPLEKIFDPNTLSNYEDNSRNHYGRQMQQPTSDLPLRDDSAQTSIRDTMIDLGGHDSDTGMSNFPDMETIKAGRRVQEGVDDEYISTLHDFSRPALSDPADINTNRRTQDWKFPSMAPPASADPELSRFPSIYEVPRPAITPGSGGRPALVHHPTEPLGAFGGSFVGAQSAMDRLSMRESLIDLDMGLPDLIPEFVPELVRPSTASSDVGSETSEHTMSANPFELERHASSYQPLASAEAQEQTGYAAEDAGVPGILHTGNPLHDLAEASDFSASDVEGQQEQLSIDHASSGYDTKGFSDLEYKSMPPPARPNQAYSRPTSQSYTFAHFPQLPAPPSAKAVSGLASHNEMKDEFNRMLGAMTSQLEAFRDVYSSSQVTQKMGSTQRQRKDEDKAPVV